MVKKESYEAALFAQKACNLSGIVRSFAKITEELWDEARELGKGTDYVNQHPISRLFAEQIMYLSCGGKNQTTSYMEASDAVEAKIREMGGSTLLEG